MDAMREVRHALRTLRREPGFAAVVVLTLAVGVGLNTALFAVVRSVLLEPLPYGEPERLAMVWTTIAERDVHESPSAFANVRDWRAQSRAWEDLAAFDPVTVTVTGGEWPEQASAARISSNLFAVLRIAPALGRTWTADEERAGARVVVLSHGAWQRRFGGARDAIGRTIDVGGRAFEVIGVMPDAFAFPDRGTELWLPQTVADGWETETAARGTGSWRVVARLRDGMSVARALNDMRALATRLEREHAANAGLGVNVVPLYEQVTGASFRLTLWMLYGAVGLVLLIACANVAHLFLARALDRSQDRAVRVALGATTTRLVRQALADSLVLALVAGAAGVILAFVALRLFVALAPADIPRLGEIAPDAAAPVYGVAVSLAAGIVFGLLPALGSAASSPYDALRAGRTTIGAPGGRRARALLIGGQFALAIVLVFGGNLLIRSLLEARHTDPGFDPDDVLMANLSVESAAARATFYARLVDDVAAIPGVRAAAIVEDLFIGGAPNRAMTIDGGPTMEPAFEEIRIDAIDGDFFRALGAPLRAGRAFAASDAGSAPPVAIVNETMARRFWPDGSPIGRRFRTGAGDSQWIEVVGVFADMRRQGPERAPIAQVLVPYAQQPSRNMVLLVRTSGEAANIAEAVRTVVAAIDRTVPLYRVTTVADAMGGYLVQRRFQTVLLAIFSAVALLLAAVGLYGLVRHSVARRTREIGVRVALGAGQGSVVRMIVRQGLAVAAPGIVAGLVLALWIADAVSALLFGVSAADVSNIAVTAGVLLLTTLLACYLPARRAARVEPIVALRHQ